MEWTRIEEKWHDIARRLQLATPGVRSETRSGPVAETEPESPSPFAGLTEATSTGRESESV